MVYGYDYIAQRIRLSSLHENKICHVMALMVFKCGWKVFDGNTSLHRNSFLETSILLFNIIYFKKIL